VPKKVPEAVREYLTALGKRGGKAGGPKGGRARMRQMTAEERRAFAMQGVVARAKNRKRRREVE
jgi:hypothetical protein